MFRCRHVTLTKVIAYIWCALRFLGSVSIAADVVDTLGKAQVDVLVDEVENSASPPVNSKVPVATTANATHRTNRKVGAKHKAKAFTSSPC